MDEKVGKFWDHYVTKKASRLFKDEEVIFTDIAKGLKLFYHLLGGEKGKELHITDKRSIQTSRTVLERFSGTGKTFFLAWQDEKGIYLPASLAYFPLKTHNEMHYYWLIAMLCNVTVNTQNITSENTRVSDLLIEKYVGFREFYAYSHRYLREHYPELSTIEPSLEASSVDNYPNPLWIYPPLSSSNKLLSSDDEEEVHRQRDEENKTEILKMKKKSEQIDDKKETDGLLLFLPESIMSLMEQVRVDRQENDSFDEDALYNAEDLEEITLGQKDANLSARIKMDLDISSNSIEEYPLGKGHFIDEWDYKKELYLKNYVCIKPIISLHTEPIELPKRLQKMMRTIQSELDLMELDRIKKDNLSYGDEINIDTWIDYKGHQNRSNHPQRFFQTFERKMRDMSTLILADVSLSTEAGITQEIRVIDMIQDALMVFSE
ncbi:VWA domain-containing protein, partial [Sulfuricurvum sp.]|uniref:VWA domain-containing protein n=1 Tax=Sulfuricurvum sp. TaxID=2025608 RepID=UPI0026182A73